MTWTLGDSGTKTATVAGTVTMTIASPCVVTMTNTLAAGDMVVFTTTGALPTGITAGTVYYVIAAGLSTSVFEFSATAGGSAVNTSGTQSGTHTCTVEHVVAQDTNNGSFQPFFDLSNLTLTDLVELRIYVKVLSGDNYLQLFKGAFQFPQTNVVKVGPPLGSDIAYQLTIKQLAGTGRAFKWKALRI